MASEDTPLIQQWREIKSSHPDAIVFFRVGDFYEMFNEDAEEGARLLGLTLTSRNNGSSRAPLAGIPVHAADGYLQKLVRLGKRVAICEQVEEAGQSKGIVRRAVTETVTPGALFDDALLEARRNNFLVALAGDPREGMLGVACADLSTGELVLDRIDSRRLPDELARLEAAELLLPRSWEARPPPAVNNTPVTYRSDWQFEAQTAREDLQRHFEVLSLEGFGLAETDGDMTGACGALVTYLVEVQPVAGAHLRPPRVLRDGHTVPLDEMTRRNLELVEPLRSSEGGGTLLAVLDQALTPMGGRLLRRWLVAPLADLEAVRARHEAVDELFTKPDRRRSVRDALSPMRDLERLSTKLAASRVTPRELLFLGGSLDRVPVLRESLGDPEAALLREERDGLDPLGDIRTEIRDAIDPDAPPNVSDGGYIRPEYDSTLDELRSVRDGAVDWIAQLQARERERTGIGSLKVGFNKVFGYYLEVTRANLDRVPDDYQRKQTLSNAERYVTPELKEWEEKVLGAEEKIAEREALLFSEVRTRLSGEVLRIQRVAEKVATIDVIAALAEVAVTHEYVRPEVHGGFEIDIRGGRHPVVETMMPREEFIPNDVRLDERARLMILTGPNMAGKSTVLRQVGLICLLAQVGSFVPARSARLGMVDRIFTRVGASDNLVRGQSTFMVEMSETAAILNGATSRSLVLLDEIGRGTSTWDGLSVASAVTEHLHDQIGAKTIFATHYHELTQLAERLPGVINFSVAVREEEEKILFLRRLHPGAADRSYGVEVARLAGLPDAVVRRAREILRTLETEPRAEPRIPRENEAPPSGQLALFEQEVHPAVERLQTVDLHNTTPLQALNLLSELASIVTTSEREPV